MKFKGIIPAMITPFNKDGSLFIEGLVNELIYLCDKGFENVFVCGSYGAFPLLSTDERKVITYVVTSMCKQMNIKTIIHIGSTSTRESVDLAKHAEECGADAVSSVVPFYYSTTIYNEDNFLKHFEEIIKNVSIDVHCYNNPKTTGYNISIPFLKRLLDIGLRGMKDGGPNIEQRIEEVLGIIDKENFDYYPSSTKSLLTGFKLGVDSCISGVALSVPELILGIYNSFHKFDYVSSLHKKAMMVREILGSKSGRAISAYDVLNSKKIDVGTCRYPWLKLKSKDAKWVVDELKKLGEII